MSFGALTRKALTPNPAVARKIIGYGSERRRPPIYLGVTPENEPIYILLPQDPSFLVKMLVEGPSGSGKSITVRNLIEGFFLEWRKTGQHRVIYEFDWKGNYLGITQPNTNLRDLYLLEKIHGQTKTLHVPNQLLNVYAPAYVAPYLIKREEILNHLYQKWKIKDLWGVPWRQIIDLAHLATVLKVSGETLWVGDMTPAFQKAAANPKMDLNDLFGYLENAARMIGNAQSKAAALNFVERWRKNKFWFGDFCKLAQHLEDPFSVNVLTFVETPEKTHFNQLAFLIALESIMTKLQALKAETHIVFVIHDILNWIGEGKPFRDQIIDTLTRLLAGQARSLYHGYTVIIETQSLSAMPRVLSNMKDYTIVIRLTWKSQSEPLRQVSGFIGGLASFHDNFYNFHRKWVVIRPPLTGYVV